MENRIYVADQNGNIKAELSGADEVILAWKGEYEVGDVIHMEFAAPGFYMIRVDDCVDDSLVYMAQESASWPRSRATLLPRVSPCIDALQIKRPLLYSFLSLVWEGNCRFPLLYIPSQITACLIHIWTDSVHLLAFPSAPAHPLWFLYKICGDTPGRAPHCASGQFQRPAHSAQEKRSVPPRCSRKPSFAPPTNAGFWCQGAWLHGYIREAPLRA